MCAKVGAGAARGHVRHAPRSGGSALGARGGAWGRVVLELRRLSAASLSGQGQSCLPPPAPPFPTHIPPRLSQELL